MRVPYSVLLIITPIIHVLRRPGLQKSEHLLVMATKLITVVSNAFGPSIRNSLMSLSDAQKLEAASRFFKICAPLIQAVTYAAPHYVILLSPTFPEIPSTFFSPSNRMDQLYILTNKRKLRFCIFHYIFVQQHIHEPYQLTSLLHTARKMENKANDLKETCT